MKTINYFYFLLSILLASCSSLQQSMVNDDIYYSPKDEVVVSNDVYALPTYDKKESAILGNKYDKEISDILEDESNSNIDTTIYKSENENENPYESIVVDSYDEAYQKRMDAMRSPYYGMNNYFITFSDDYWYAQAYFNDPFYNVVILGDQIWVEPYWMSTWNSYRYPYYYGSSYYRPYYYNSYYGSYYNPYYSYYPYYSYSNNDNYVSSSFHSFRQRSLSGTTSTRSSIGRTSRDLPESYIGRDITTSSTVKSGIDRQSNRTSRSGEVRTISRTVENNLGSETIRVRESNRERTGTSIRTPNTQEQSGAVSSDNRNYTRPQQATRSTYNSPTRSTTRYNRPESSNVSSGNGSSGVSRTPSNSGTNRSGSGSSYTPNKSSGSSGSTSVRQSSTRSSGNSGGTVNSSGSSRSSGSSSGSSGSSRSSSESGSGRGRR